MYIDENYFFWFLVITDVVVLALFLRIVWIDRQRKKRELWKKL